MSTRVQTLAGEHEPTETVVEWPHTVVSAEEKDRDLGLPLAQLLVDLAIKGNPSDEEKAVGTLAAVTGTPVSVAIIEAGATAASKGWAALLTALGGGAAVWAAVSDFWSKEQSIRGTLILAVAMVISACVLGVAAIMYGDVRARGQGAAAQYQARAEVAKAFLEGAAGLRTAAIKSEGVEIDSAIAALAITMNGNGDGPPVVPPASGGPVPPKR